MREYPENGHVEPSGPAIELVDGPLRLRKRSVGEMDNNVYVVACTRTGQSLVVDAADDAPLIRDLVGDTTPLAVVQTHGHWDHVRAWDDLAADPGLDVWGHEGDADLFPRPVDRSLSDGDVLAVGDLAVEVLHVPGHTPGSLMFLVRGGGRPCLVSGDSLFPGGPGNTWGDAEKFDQLMTGLEDRVFGTLPDDTHVLPGHGDDTTLGRERDSLPEWRERGW